jgi:membrane protease YdiL (CAAX protease family)
LLISALAFEGGLVLVAWGLGRLTGRWPPSSWQLGFSSLAWGVAAVAPLLIVLQWTRVSRLAPLRGLTEAVDRTVVPLFAGCSALDLALISLAAGVGEEVLFRGVIQPGLADWLGPWVGLVLTSMLFGLVHPVNVAYVVYAAAVGLYLGGLALAFDNVVVPLTTHAAYDFVALYFLTRVAPRISRAESAP